MGVASVGESRRRLEVDREEENHYQASQVRLSTAHALEWEQECKHPRMYSNIRGGHCASLRIESSGLWSV